ncbi:uncharacterized protein LOC117315431 [Pecten maximus]|uniref:uncharacterized protein LOC117315431 n=1 Tax=Pecten maximus TaxID=6579 RepID=UPI001457FDAE|nr:uncharacterized protein LOC117315431 [Pecten maximus]
MAYPSMRRTIHVVCYGLMSGLLLACLILYDRVYDLPIMLQMDTRVVPTKINHTLRKEVQICSIPNLYPFSPDVYSLIRIRKYHPCQHWNLITYQKGLKVIVNKTVISKYYPNFSRCSYRPYVKRINHHNEIKLLKNKFMNFTESIKVTDEFCVVVCFNIKDKILTREQHAFVIRNETLIKLRQRNRNATKGETLSRKRPLDVVMIGLESTSRMNFIRHMDFTRNFLRKKMAAVELKGYNKLGKNTFPNIIPMMLGIPVQEMNDSLMFYDNYPFIWKDFKKAGYVTLMGQDGTSMAVYHYLRKGFRQAPVDYYMRPYILGMERTNSDGLCSGNKLILQGIFDKLADFITTYHDVPKFTFTFINDPTHSSPNGLGIVDLPLKRTLSDLHTRGLLNNTLLLIFGDHGSRYGPIRKSFQGRLEESLPAFYVSLPRWFREEHSDLYENLKENRDKLTSNVDVYATLHDIIELGKGHVTPRVTGKYGTSLLRNISRGRTCADLKIPPNYCMCQSSNYSYSNKSKIAYNISQRVVKEINIMLLNVSHLCTNLTLSTIRHVWSLGRRFKNEVKHFSTKIYFVVQFTVLPSHADFEATVRYFKGEFSLIGDILRTNKYAGQSDCVLRHKNAIVLERYCYCRK